MSVTPGDAVSKSGSATAAEYDSWFESPWGRYAAGLEFDLIAESLGPVAHKRILDVGCGTGWFGKKLAGSGAEVFGIDLDPHKLELARARLHGIVLGDAHHLPCESGAFDAALALTLCEFSGDPGGVLFELARVTRSGGRIVIGLLNKESPWGWFRRTRLRRPPWNEAVFIDVNEFLSSAGRYGGASLSSGLFSPGVALPGFVSRIVEAAGRRLVPGSGALQVITVVRR